MKKLGMAVFLVLFVATSGWATVLTYEFNYEFSGGTPPAGPSPWLSATFDDGGMAGFVTLTMSAAGLIGSEFVTEWYFNLDPAFNPNNLSISHVSGEVASSIDTGTDAFKADGDGLYDIQFSYPTDASNRFISGESSIYTFSLADITANSFDFLSAPGGGNGPFYAAAKVQGIGPGASQSGWVAPTGEVPPVPEPSTLLLLGAGLLGLVGFGRKFRKE